MHVNNRKGISIKCSNINHYKIDHDCNKNEGNKFYYNNLVQNINTNMNKCLLINNGNIEFLMKKMDSMKKIV